METQRILRHLWHVTIEIKDECFKSESSVRTMSPKKHGSTTKRTKLSVETERRGARRISWRGIEWTRYARAGSCRQNWEVERKLCKREQARIMKCGRRKYTHDDRAKHTCPTWLRRILYSPPTPRPHKKRMRWMRLRQWWAQRIGQVMRWN